MVTSIHNSWGELHTSLAQILALTRHSLCIFDGDLAQLELSCPGPIEQLQRLITENPASRIRIALKKTDHLHRDAHHLVQLLASYSHVVQVQQTPENLAHLRDTLVISDGTHALIRFDQDHPRSKLILADPQETTPYLQRFESIWTEGGDAFSPTPLGL